MDDKFVKRGMITVIHMFNEQDNIQNACGDKDDKEKKNSSDEETGEI